jgi:formate-dependent nitrite reductase membrane component NrfD
MNEFTVFHTIAWPSAYAWYFFVIGISAALFFFSALSWFRAEFETLRTSGAYGSFAALVAGGLLLVTDLSQPLRFWHMINPIYWNPTSPLVWGAILLLAFGTVSALYILALRSGNRDRARTLAIAGALIGLGLPVYTGLDLTVHQHRAVWNSSLMPVLAVALSLVSGAAVASFLAQGRGDLLGRLRHIMVWSAGAVAVMLVSLMVTTAYGGSASELTWMFMTSGAMGFVFLGLGLFAGTLVPVAILAGSFGRQPTGILAASILVLLGGIALRYSILVGPQLVHTYF